MSQINFQQLAPLVADLRQLDAALARINNVLPQIRLLDSQAAQLEQQANALSALPQLRNQAAALRAVAANNRTAANQLNASLSADQALIQRVRNADGLQLLEAQRIVAQSSSGLPRFT